MKKAILLTILIGITFLGCSDNFDNSIVSSTTEVEKLTFPSQPDDPLSDNPNARNLYLHRDDKFTDVDKYSPSADSVFIPLNLPESVIPSLEMSQVIDGNVGGKIEIYYEFQDSLANIISIEATLDFPEDAFVGTEEFTMKLNNQIGTVSFYPHMVFDKPVEYSVVYTGIDLSGIDPNSVDFIFQNYDGTTELINYYDLTIKPLEGKLDLYKADLNHFSRYGWVR